MKVPISLFILWAICLVGIVVGFGRMDDAYTIAGYHLWKVVGIICSVLFVLGIFIYFGRSGGSDKQE